MRRRFARLRLDRAIPWLLRDADPIEIPLSPLPGWILLTPLAMLRGVTPERYETEVTLRGGACFVQSDELCFKEVASSGDGGQAFHELVARAPALLTRLRFLAKQPSLARRLLMSMGMDAPESSRIGKRKMPPWAPTKCWFVPRYLLNAVTAQHLDDLSHGPPLGDSLVPVYADILLDAIDAHVSQDFRRSILYAAIATETMVHMVLDDAHSRANPADPVFGLLKKQRGFPSQLHEASLYVLKRSLLLSEKTTYDNAVILAKMRNAIAHTGGPKPRDTLTLDAAGSATALATAKSVFAWYGVEHDYPTDTSSAPVDAEHPSAFAF
jgi:hypothetical protein